MYVCPEDREREREGESIFEKKEDIDWSVLVSTVAKCPVIRRVCHN